MVHKAVPDRLHECPAKPVNKLENDLRTSPPYRNPCVPTMGSQNLLPAQNRQVRLEVVVFGFPTALWAFRGHRFGFSGGAEVSRVLP